MADEKFYRARVTRRTDFAPDLWSLRILPEGEFSFTPGQYATLGMDEGGRRLERPYSIVSSPREPELEFFFELVPQGVLTPPLFRLHEGDELVMRKVAKGRFTLELSGGRSRHLMVSTVTGIAPFVSYVRTLFRDWKEGRFAGDHNLFLLNGASRSWELGYCEELKEFAKQAPWLEYVPTVSRPWDDANWQGEIGRVDDLLRKYSDQWGLNGANAIAYICGQPQMIDNSKGILKRIGFTKETMKEEVYWVPARKAVV